jgi:16S rRNA (cytosine1407-C5)-methyltransferase
MINEKFEAYYSEIYGSRWEILRKSLLEERPAYEFSQGLKTPYFLDYASVLAARSLRLPAAVPEQALSPTVLDACAAPGGKTLVIASELAVRALSPSFQLLANELSADRRRRLSDVLDKHLDNGTRKQVRVCGFDAAGAGRRKSEHNRFQAILLDAPCSSEAHVLKDKRAMAAWTPARPRILAQRQWALLSSVFLLLSPGGSLVYSTCAITNIENDNVVRRLFEKYGEKAEIDPPDFTEGEKTEFGRIILPDNSGIGPLYVARIKKKD